MGIRAARPGPIFFSPSRAGPICFQPDRAEKAEPDPGPIGIGLARSSPIMQKFSAYESYDMIQEEEKGNF